MAALKKTDGETRAINKYLSRILEFYSYYATKHPLIVKSISSALSSGLGNIVSQKIVKRGKARGIEYRSVMAFTSFGFCVTGPLVHFFYEYLDKLVPRKLPYSKYKRLAVDRALFSPILLLVFFYTVAILEGMSHNDAVAKIKQNYWTALKMSWRVWIIFQFFNINYVPIQYRVLCGNIMAFLWSIYLATKRSQ